MSQAISIAIGRIRSLYYDKALSQGLYTLSMLSKHALRVLRKAAFLSV